MAKRSRLKLMATSILSAILWMLLFASSTSLIGRQRGYDVRSPKQLTLRLQTDAFLAGKLSLQDKPFGHCQDWVWANGLHHTWGLGVPLIRLPFELWARILGSPGFPDRLTLAFFFTLTALLLAQNLKGLGSIERWLVVSGTLLTPAFLSLLKSRFEVYEEVIAYAGLYAILLTAVVLRQTKLRAREVSLAGIIVGFGPWIRPTLLFAAVASLIWIAIQIARSRVLNRSKLFGILFLSAAAPILTLGCANQIRFGSPIEFGHSLNLSLIGANDMSLRFGYPFAHEKIWPALKEFVGSTFFVSQIPIDDNEYYSKNQVPWQSNTFRYREFTFLTFSPLSLGLLIVAGLMLAVFAFRRRGHSQKETCGFEELAQGLAFHSLLQFLGLAAFYLFTPSYSSRYTCDFAPSVALAGLALYLWGRKWSRIVSGGIGGVYLCMYLLPQLSLEFTRKPHFPQDERALVGLLQNLKKDDHQTCGAVLTNPPLPDFYSCENEIAGPNIRANGWGWDKKNGCRTEISSTHFFSRPECITLQVTWDMNRAPSLLQLRLRNLSGTARENALLSWIRMKGGLDEWKRVAVMRTADGASLTFCDPFYRKRAYELVSVAWIPSDDSARVYSPFNLQRIEKIADAATHQSK